MDIHFDFKAGDECWDDLTGQKVRVLCVEFKHGAKKGERVFEAGTIAYWVDNEWLDGGRHPWEVSKVA